jgi:hypothetical protein
VTNLMVLALVYLSFTVVPYAPPGCEQRLGLYCQHVGVGAVGSHHVSGFWSSTRLFDAGLRTVWSCGDGDDSDLPRPDDIVEFSGKSLSHEVMVGHQQLPVWYLHRGNMRTKQANVKSFCQWADFFWVAQLCTLSNFCF